MIQTILDVGGFVAILVLLLLVLFGATRDERDNMRGHCKRAP